MSYRPHPQHLAYGFPTDRPVPEVRQRQTASRSHPRMTYHAQSLTSAGIQQRSTHVSDPAQTASHCTYGVPMASLAIRDAGFVPSAQALGPESSFLPSNATMSEAREDHTHMDLDLSDRVEQVDRGDMFQPITYESMSYPSSNGMNEHLAVTSSYTSVAGDPAFPTFQDRSISNSTAFNGGPSFVDGSYSDYVPEPSQWSTSRSNMVGSLPRQSRDSGLPSSSNSSDASNQHLPPMPQRQASLDHSTIAACSSWLAKYGSSMPSKTVMEHLSLAFDVPYEAVLEWFLSQMDRPLKGEGSGLVSTELPEPQLVSNIGPSGRRCKRVTSAKQNANTKLGRFHCNDKPLFVCTSLCGVTFTAKAGWKRHEKIKRPPTLWRCQIPACQITLKNEGYFSRKHGLKEHYWNVHSTKCSQQELSSYENPIERHFDEPCIFKNCPSRFLIWDEWIEHIGKHFESDIWDISQWRDVEEEDIQADGESRSDLSGGEGRSEDDEDPGSSQSGHAPSGMPHGRSGAPGSGFSGPSARQRQCEGRSGKNFDGPKGSQLDLHSLVEKLAGIGRGGDDNTHRVFFGSGDPIWEHLTSWTRQSITNLSLKCKSVIISAQERLRVKLESRNLAAPEDTAQSPSRHLVRTSNDGACKDTNFHWDMSRGNQITYVTLYWVAMSKQQLTGLTLLHHVIPSKLGFLTDVSDLLCWRESAKQQRSNVNSITEDAIGIIAKGADPFHTSSKSSFHPNNFEYYIVYSSFGVALVEFAHITAYKHLQMTGKSEYHQGSGSESFPHMRRFTQSARPKMNCKSDSMVIENCGKDYGRLNPQLNDAYLAKICMLPTVKVQQRKPAIVRSALAYTSMSLQKGLQNNTRDQKSMLLHKEEKKMIKGELWDCKGEPHTDEESETSGMLPSLSDLDDSIVSDVTSVSTTSLRVHNSDAKAGEVLPGSHPIVKKPKSARPPTSTYGLPLMLKSYLESDEDCYKRFFVTGEPRVQCQRGC